jgi:hypothetical protein
MVQVFWEDSVSKWINQFNFTDRPCDPPEYERIWPLPWRKRILVNYQVDIANPPTFLDNCGRMIRGDQHIHSDGGTIPPFATWLTGISPGDFKPAFYFHDLGYRCEGFWFWTFGAWVFIRLTREQIDSLLYEMLRAAGASVWQAEVIYNGVRVGGGFAWNHHAAQREQEARKRAK